LPEYSIGGKENKTKKTVVLHFEDSVLVKTSLFSIGLQTLLTRLGGYIGGGRTLFWLVVAALGLIKSFGIIVYNLRKQ
jgi:hypothetical protein